MADALPWISKARTTLLVACPFLGHLALRLRPRFARPKDHVSTAAIADDGTLVLCESFLDSLSPSERAGLLGHEVCHAALFHGRRRGSRDAAAFNIACDASINLVLAELAGATDRRIVLPPGALLEPSLAGLSAEEIYETMVRSTLPPSQPAGDLRPDLAETPDGRAAAAGDMAAARRLAAEWRVALAQAAQAHSASGRGDLPGSVQRLVAGALGPARIDWRTQLRDWIGNQVRCQELTYLRPSRRSESAGALLPGPRRDRYDPDVVVMIDTSGSMGDARLREALGEVDSICAELGLHLRVLIFDAAVQGDLEIDEARELVGRLRGGGGSDARPAFERLAAEAGLLAIVFTDGDLRVPTDAPDALRGVLWVLEDSDLGAPARWGEVLRIPAQAAA